MGTKEYLSIRGEANFLYLYFLKCGGINCGEQRFYGMLNHWIASKGINIRVGQAKILNFLDIKFGV